MFTRSWDTMLQVHEIYGQWHAYTHRLHPVSRTDPALTVPAHLAHVASLDVSQQASFCVVGCFWDRFEQCVLCLPAGSPISLPLWSDRAGDEVSTRRKIKSLRLTWKEAMCGLKERRDELKTLEMDDSRTTSSNYLLKTIMNYITLKLFSLCCMFPNQYYFLNISKPLSTVQSCPTQQACNHS